MNNWYTITDPYLSYNFFQKYLKKSWPLMLLTSLKIIICSININLDFRKPTLHVLVERVSKALDTGKYVVGVFLDLKRHSTCWIIVFY